MLVASACHKTPVVTDRTVTAYVPTACAADGSAYAQYSAYGDFDPVAPPATGYLSDVGVVLPGIDDEARALVMTASNDSLRAWEGVGSVPATGDVNVLVLPTLNSCALTQSVGPRTGSVMAAIGGEQVLVVGGTGNPTPASYVARLDTGEVAALTADLATPRTGASITGFPGGALVAGGTSDIGPLANAEVYSTSTDGFDGQIIPLSEERTQHGAVVLAGGQTLLVGGIGAMNVVLESMDIVDPVAGSAHEEGVGNLMTARRNATVLRLASGEILVGGGFDATGAPVTSFEWFAADATPELEKTTIPLTPGLEATMIALEGGGALVVATTPPSTPGFQNAWVIDASGTLEPAAPVPPPMASPVLFGGAGGAPVLWTGDRWLQWQAYGGSFGAISVLDDMPAVVGDATCSPDPGLAMWLDPKQLQLTLLRIDTTNAYSSLPGPLLVTGTVTGAQDTSPDRLTGVVWDTNMGLTLEPGTPGAAAFVTDRSYADVAVSVDVGAGPAVVALRDTLGIETDVPGVACGATPPSQGGYTLQVERHGASVTWTTDTGLTGTCDLSATGDARVSVGVRAGGTTQGIVTNLIVSRLGTP